MSIDLIGSEPQLPYTPAVRWNDLVIVSGQIGVRATDIHHPSVTEQLERIFDQLAALLEQAGGGMSDVVKTTVYLTSLEHYPTLNEVYGSRLGNVPARSTVIVADLVRGAEVEIEALAIIKP